MTAIPRDGPSGEGPSSVVPKDRRPGRPARPRGGRGCARGLFALHWLAALGRCTGSLHWAGALGRRGECANRSSDIVTCAPVDILIATSVVPETGELSGNSVTCRPDVYRNVIN